MRGKKPSYEELQRRLEEAEAALAALRRGEVDLVLGDGGPLLVRLKSLIDANEQLRREWEATFDALSDAVFVLDTQQRVLRSNAAAESLFGCLRTEMIGKQCCEIVHGTATPLAECPFFRMVESLQRENMDMHLGERCLAVTIDPILDQAGRLTGAVHIARDITAQKRGEEALQASEESYRLLAETMPNAMIVHDMEGRIQYANPAALQLCGLDAENVIGQPIGAFIPPALHASLDKRRAQRTQGDHTCYRYETEVLGKSGQKLCLEVHSTPVVRHGKVEQILIVARDITERKRAEAAVLEGREYLQAVLDSINDAVFVDDADTGKIIDANRGMCEMYGYSLEEALHLSIGELSLGKPPYSQAEAMEWLRKTREIGPQTFEWLAKHKDGHTFWVEVSTRFAVIGGHNRFVVIVRDITKRKHAEEALQAALERSQRQQDTVAMVAVLPAIVSGNLAEAVSQITELGARVMGVERVGVWLLDEREEVLRCVDLYEASRDRHSAGAVLARHQYQNEFDALLKAKYVDADDALTDPRTAGYVEGYLKPLGITSMLDAVVRVQGRNLGVICFEHVNQPHHWQPDEIAFACQMSDQIALLLLNRERREAEKKLRESEETYRNLFHNAQVGLFRTRISDGKILESNEQLARMFGYDSREDFIANYATGENYVDPGTRERLLELLRRDGYVENFEARFYRKDRSIIWVRYSARLYPEQGWIEGVAEDITARKQAEEALRESEERFRRAVAEAPYPIAIYAEDGEVLLVNAEWSRITGYRREDIPTIEAWLEKAYGQRQKAARRLIARFFAGAGPIATNDTVIRCRDGTTRTWSFRSTPLGRDERGRKLALSMAVDVTERQLLEAQLRQAQKMEAIGRLAGGVAHDFNNLLQAMSTAVYSLRLRSSDAATAKATAELEKYVRRGADLTRQLLLSSRRAQPQIEPCNINEIMRRAENLLRRLLPENISVCTELAKGELSTAADLAQLEQVLMNLAVNARDAMPEGGQLVLRTGCLSEAEIFFEVEDSGIGMTPEVQERIFEPFFTTKAHGQGTGLGLAVVHGIVTQHSGRVEVKSVPGRGSTFRVVLPRRRAKQAEPLTTEKATAPTEGHGERVLLVEDEKGAREGLSEILGLLGYEVTAVASAEDALALPEDAPFHALLTDLMLPGMTGGRLATTLLARWPNLRVILMSGYPEDERVRHDLPVGVRFLQKPFDIDTLAHALRAVLEVAKRKQ